LSLTGVVELYFLFDYFFDGTLVCAGQTSNVFLGTSMEEAWADGYWVATVSVLAFAVGVWLRSEGRLASQPTRAATPPYEARTCVVVFGFTVLAGILGLVMLLGDPSMRDHFFYEHIGLAPPVGMGRYSVALYVLPSAGVALWYTSTRIWGKRLRSAFWRAASVAALFGLSLIHLAQGRRLMWLCTILMALHLVKVAGVFRLKMWHVAASIPFILVVSSFVEAAKHTGMAAIATVPEMTSVSVTSKEAMLNMVNNSVSRFAVSADIIANRPNKGYYFGLSFLESLTGVLPASMRGEERYNMRNELGELIYGSSRVHLVSEEGSLIAEAYANLGYAGCVIVFLVLGYLCASLDLRFQNATTPLAAIGYAFALFRIGHHLVTVSHSSVPLTFDVFLPWVVALLLVKFHSPHRFDHSRALRRFSVLTPPRTEVKPILVP